MEIINRRVAQYIQFLPPEYFSMGWRIRVYKWRPHSRSMDHIKHALLTVPWVVDVSVTSPLPGVVDITCVHDSSADVVEYAVTLKHMGLELRAATTHRTHVRLVLTYDTCKNVIDNSDNRR